MRTHWRSKTKQQLVVNFSQFAGDFWLTHQCFTSSALQNALYFSSLGSSFSFFLLHCHSLALSALLSLLTLLQRVPRSLMLWGWAPGSMTKCNKSQWPRVHFHSSTQKSKQQQDYASPQFTLRKGICDRAKEATEILVTPFQHCTLIYSVPGSVTGSKYISTKDYFKSLVIY